MLLRPHHAATGQQSRRTTVTAAILCRRTVGRSVIRCGDDGPAAGTQLLWRCRPGGRRWTEAGVRVPPFRRCDGGPWSVGDARPRCRRADGRRCRRQVERLLGWVEGAGDAAATAGQIVAIDVVVAVPAEQLVHGRFGEVLRVRWGCACFGYSYARY